MARKELKPNKDVVAPPNISVSDGGGGAGEVALLMIVMILLFLLWSSGFMG